MYTAEAWRNWVCVGFGMWLLTLPLVTGSVSDDALSGWNVFLSGLAAAGVGIATLERPGRAKRWTKLALGVWLLLSPFLLGFSHDPALMWSCLLPGLMVGGDAFVAVWRPGRPSV